MAGVFDYTPAPKARRLAIFAGLGTAALSVLSVMGLNFGAISVSFLMVPTFAIYLWPQGANPVLSLIAITLAGLFLDNLSFGPNGLWPLTWMVLFLVYRPDARAKPSSFIGQWAGSFLVLAAVVGAHYVLGRFFLNTPVNTASLALSAVTAFMIFPFFYMVREYAARAFGDRDDYYYESPKK